MTVRMTMRPQGQVSGQVLVVLVGEGPQGRVSLLVGCLGWRRPTWLLAGQARREARGHVFSEVVRGEKPR